MINKVNFFNYDLTSQNIKTGEIKVQSDEMLYMVQGMLYLVGCLQECQDHIDEKKHDVINNISSFSDKIYEKYIEMSYLRQEQKNWYDVIKRIDSGEFDRKGSPEELDQFRREIWGFYIEAKFKREQKAEKLKKEQENINELMKSYYLGF